MKGGDRMSANFYIYQADRLDSERNKTGEKLGLALPKSKRDEFVTEVRNGEWLLDPDTLKLVAEEDNNEKAKKIANKIK